MGGTGERTLRRMLTTSDWTLLDWGVRVSFSITIMHTPGIEMRKVTFWVPHGYTSGNYIRIRWWETLPWGGIEVRGRSGQEFEYTYRGG